VNVIYIPSASINQKTIHGKITNAKTQKKAMASLLKKKSIRAFMD